MANEPELFETPYEDALELRMADLLPTEVSTSEIQGDVRLEALYPEEQVLMSRAVAKRQREFALGRMCARQAMINLGVPPRSISINPDRSPVWPAGIVGSITHCETYAAAAVAFCTNILSVGIDAELNRPLPEGILTAIASIPERSHLARLVESSVCWDVVLFSAKESIFKACFPVTKEWMDFSAAHVELDPQSHSFTAVLRSEGWCGRRVWGRFGVKGSLVLTAVTLLHEEQEPKHTR